MATIEEQVAEINATIAAEKAEVAAELKKLMDKITELEGSQGGTLTPEQVASIKQGINDIYQPLSVPINPI